MSKEVFFEVDLNTPLGPIRGRVSVNTGPMGLVELVPTALELTNMLVDRARKREEREGKRISCQAGCGTCCCQMVPISAPEAFYLADLVESLPPDRREDLLERFEVIKKELERQHLIDELLDPLYGDDGAMTTAKKYFFLNLPCPFLVNESCSIHPYRPVACREYNVTSPPPWCADPYSYEVSKVPMPLPLSAPLASLTAQLTDSKPRLIPLTLTPFWVVANTSLRQRQWPGLELFQQFMAEIGKPWLQQSPPPDE
ncbi:MAG: YkgJ family cysteine cluster protein [Deltaproteobacteria bacterium]|nr:MAG: YkgJ family cysteine cluster protein [Deltaproteobacteria bacterium]